MRQRDSPHQGLNMMLMQAEPLAAVCWCSRLLPHHIHQADPPVSHRGHRHRSTRVPGSGSCQLVILENLVPTTLVGVVLVPVLVLLAFLILQGIHPPPPPV